MMNTNKYAITTKRDLVSTPALHALVPIAACTSHHYPYSDTPLTMSPIPYIFTVMLYGGNSFRRWKYSTAKYLP